MIIPDPGSGRRQPAMIEAPDQRRHQGPRHQQAKIGWIPVRLLGIPIPVVLVIFLLRGCT